MNTRQSARWIAIAAIGLLAVSPAHAGPGVVDEQVDGNVLEARIKILGIEFADLRIEFEDVSGLAPGALGLSARLLGPLELIALVLRLPDRLLTSLPIELPILLRIQPGPGLSMRGVASVSLHSDLVHYLPGSPLRLFAAPIGGQFEDVTAESGAGSYRGGAVRPDFGSEYAFGVDMRPRQTVAEDKLDALDDLLAEHAPAIAPAVLADLEQRAAAVRAAFESGDPGAAAAALDGFAAAVYQASGEGVPDVWDAGETLANTAGELRSQAATLRYSLLQLVPGS